MNFKIVNKNGITLHTKNKYCREDIVITLSNSLIPSGTLDITENGEYDVEKYAEVNVNVEGIDTSDGTITADKVLKDEIGYAKEERIVGAIETYDYSNSEEVSPEIDKFLMGEYTEIYNDRVTTICAHRFEKDTRLTSVIFPNVVTLGINSLNDCTNLSKIYIPKLTIIGANSFENCPKLLEGDFPNVNKIGSNAFNSCGITYLSLPSITTIEGRTLGYSKIKTLHIPNVEKISDYSFYRCYELTKIIIEQTESVATLASTANVFKYAYHFLGEVNATYNPEGLKDGLIFVPDELLDSYKSSTNWSTYADQIKPLSELEVE